MMKSKRILFVFLALILSVAGCSTTLQPTSLNEEGYFDTETQIRSEGIKTVEDFRPEYRQLLFVKTESKDDELGSFFFESFENMNWFGDVKDKGAMEALVIEKGLTDEVSGISDRIGLHNLQKQIGTFLVVETDAKWEGGYDYVAMLTAFDPQTGKDVLVLENTAFNWSGLDKPLFYPLLNAFLEWARGQEISSREE